MITIDVNRFAGKKEMFDYLVKNKTSIISMKKAALKKCDAVGVIDKLVEIKAFEYSNEDNITGGIIKRWVIGNTYNWMDSHDDVHLDGTFGKSIKEHAQKVLHLHDHIHQLDAKVGEPINIVETKTNWVDLGVALPGETTVLAMYTEIKKDYNNKIYSQYLDKSINQHSVGMMYVNLHLAINDEDYKDEYKTWSNNITKIANQERAVERGFFWAVTEAKLIEISAVIAGSNPLTQTIEPQKALNKNDFADYFIKNFKL